MSWLEKYKQLKKISNVSLLEESPQLPIVIRGVIITFVVIIFLIIWASFATIQETSTTFGEIVPKGRIQKVQDPAGGVVKTVFVNNGEIVKRGQVLIKMDEASRKAELEKAQSREIALILNKERLEAYVAKKPADLLQWSQAVIQSKYNTVERQDQINNLLTEEKALLASQNTKRSEQREILHVQLAQQEDQLKKFENQLVVWDKHIGLLEQEQKIYLKLKTEQYISHRGYLTILRELNSARGERERLISEINRLKKVVTEYSHKISELDATLDAAAQKELGEVNDELLTVRHQIEKLESALQQTDIRAPVYGIIKGLRVFAGNVVQPGGLLVEVVPLNEDMVAETRIHPKDIGHVQVGDEVIVKPVAYDYARYGSIKGTLVEISASTFTDENDKPYYKAVTKLSRQYLQYGKQKKHLIPGMTVTADIITGKKTLMEYLLKPIRSSASEAFHER